MFGFGRCWLECGAISPSGTRFLLFSIDGYSRLESWFHDPSSPRLGLIEGEGLIGKRGQSPTLAMNRLAVGRAAYRASFLVVHVLHLAFAPTSATDVYCASILGPLL